MQTIEAPPLQFTRIAAGLNSELRDRDADEPTAARLPVLLTVDEAADFSRTTRRAIIAMIERRQLPGVIRIRRRVLGTILRSQPSPVSSLQSAID